jgi:fatty-acid peroxygenase
MAEIPRDQRLDSTMVFVGDPYGFISSECRRRGTDLFQTRLMFRKTICMYGKEAAELFYDPDRFMRRGAMPMRIQKTLVGRGGVQGLDGDAHRHRKQMFMSLVSDERVAALVTHAEDGWRRAAEEWRRRDRVVLYDAARCVLSQAVCAWAGVPLQAPDVRRRTEDLTAMFQDAGTVGLPHWRARAARKRSEAWMQDMIGRVRSGRFSAPADSALHVIATYRDLNGRVLPPRIAAVELLNVLRPTVAVSVFITFAARSTSASGSDSYITSAPVCLFRSLPTPARRP